MKNWAIQGIIFDLNPTPQTFLKFRWSHFHFCKKADPSITASLYLDNLVDELNYEAIKITAVNKKSLTTAVIKKVLQNKQTKQNLIALFEKSEVQNADIKHFLNTVASINLSNNTQEKNESVQTVTSPDFPVRTYVIATHISLEINNNELHYETLIRDTSALKEFIISKFNASKLSDRISDMKNFSYKKILQGKNNDAAKGQLKPQLKQVATNPGLFGKSVSDFAENILKSHFEETK